jgi:hypothetical protein
MSIREALLIVLLAAGCGGLPDGSDRRSQPAEVRQRMGSIELRVRYNRPSARGRVLFGGIVPWDSVWDPGADEATRLETSADIRVNGELLRKGSYSLWAIPRPGAWTVIFSRKAKVQHVPYPPGHDALRLTVRPESGPFVESLCYDFPVATADSSRLLLRWGTTVIPLSIRPQ